MLRVTTIPPFAPLISPIAGVDVKSGVMSKVSVPPPPTAGLELSATPVMSQSMLLLTSVVPLKTASPFAATYWFVPPAGVWPCIQYLMRMSLGVKVVLTVTSLFAADVVLRGVVTPATKAGRMPVSAEPSRAGRAVPFARTIFPDAAALETSPASTSLLLDETAVPDVPTNASFSF